MSTRDTLPSPVMRQRIRLKHTSFSFETTMKRYVLLPHSRFQRQHAPFPLPLFPPFLSPSHYKTNKKSRKTPADPPAPTPPNPKKNPPHQSSSSSSFLCIAFFLASSASARLPARFGFDELAPFSPPPPLRLMPESLACSAAGLRPAAGLLAGGAGGVGLALPFGAGGGGGARGAGAGAACSST